MDVAVIGAGTAGLAAWRAARRWTDDVVLIEGGEYGTTCARVGCMPSKLLIAAAEAAHAVREAPMFGVTSGDPRVDGKAVMARVRSERDRFVGFVLESVDSIPEARRVRGRARFVGDHRLRVDDRHEIVADRIVIATGSTPVVPAGFAGLGDRLIVNDDIFEWTDLPRSVAVFGPGVIGLEIGQALHRLGVQVMVFGLGGFVGPLTDPAVRRAAGAAFAAEFPLDADAGARVLRRDGDGVIVGFVGRDGRPATRRVDYVVAATGRAPDVSRLGLESTSLPLDARGVPVSDPGTAQVGQSHVFIAGDASNHRPLLHEAADEGRIAGDNAGRWPDVRRGRRTSPLSVVFTDPQVALVGDTRAALAGRQIVTGAVSFENQGRSRVMLKNRGLLHVYADARDGRFLGAEMVGPRAEHIGHLLAWAHQSKLTVADMLSMPFYHPVVEEGLRSALRDACRQLEDCARRAA